MRLIADIGGTNARVALCAKGAIDAASVQRFTNAQWNSLDDVLRAYCGAHPDAAVEEMVIAVAGPVHAGRATLTNRNWTITADGLALAFSCKRVVLLNDLGALGFAVPMLGADQVSQLCGEDSPNDRNGQALVVGIGTGFNVSQVITKELNIICPPAEAGHISMPSAVASELRRRGYNPNLFPTVESLFSGRGLTAFSHQVSGVDNLTAEAVIKSYGTPEMPGFSYAIDTYAELLGLLLHDFSLIYMPSHGTFLGGSVGRAIAACAPGPLINVFQKSCKFRLQRCPSIFVVEEDGAALLGCAHF